MLESLVIEGTHNQDKSGWKIENLTSFGLAKNKSLIVVLS